MSESHTSKLNGSISQICNYKVIMHGSSGFMVNNHPTHRSLTKAESFIQNSQFRVVLVLVVNMDTLSTSRRALKVLLRHRR